MKTKVSFILKASLALVLALLMLFGSVTTSFAAVVNKVETGATARTVYITPASVWSNYSSTDTIKICSKPDANNGWTDNNLATQDMTDTGRTYNGNEVFSGSYYVDGSNANNNFNYFKIMRWEGSTCKEEIVVNATNGWSNDAYNGKLCTADGTWLSTWSYDPVLTKLGTPSLKCNNATTTPVDLYGASSASLTWASVSNASSYTVYKDGTAVKTNATSPYSVTSTGSYTVKAIGDGTTYSDSNASNAIQVNFHEFYLLGLKNDYDWDVKDANKMTYNSTTGLYEITRNIYQGSTTYGGTDASNPSDTGFKVYDTVGATYYGKNSTCLTTSSTSASSLSTSGNNIRLTTKNLSSASSSAVPYKFTYNASTKEVKVYYPMKVTYNMQSHGTNPSANGYVVAYGSKITAPTAPTATGYTFGGWYKEAACTNAWNFNTDTVTADTVLYAKWTGESKTLTVQARAKETSSDTSYGTSAPSIESQLKIAGTTQTSAPVSVGSSVTVAAPDTDPEGYVFVGWYDGTTQKSTSKSYSYTMATTAKTLTARYDRKYTLTIQNKSGDNHGTLGGGTTKTVYYDDTPANFTVTPAAGYRLDYTNSDNLSKYYSQPSSTTGTITVSGKSVTTADKSNATIKVAYTPITPVITYGAKKTDDGSTYTDGGGSVAAKEIHYTAAVPGTGTASYLYLWWSGSGNPEQHNKKVDAVKGTDNCYYGSFEPSGNFYFNITDSSSSATAGTQKLNSSTTADKDSSFAYWTTVGNWGSYYIGKGYLNSGTTVYIKYDATNNKVYFRNTAFTYTIAYSGGSGGTAASETEVRDVTSGGTITYNNRVRFTATAASGYSFVGWYSNSSFTGSPVSTDRIYTTADLTDDYTLYALFKKQDFITLYNSYELHNGKWTFVAAPPRKVEIGSGNSMRTYVYGTGLSAQRGEEYVLNDSGTYYEGNKLVVFPGENIKLYYTTLASSDAIKGVFYNNDIRYSTELEPDNYYVNRSHDNQTGTPDEDGNYPTGDDDFGKNGYPFTTTTTLFADPDSYDGSAVDTINANKSGYVAQNGMNEREHTLEWTAQGSYLNIDIELANKRQLHINGDDWSGITITGMNDEGYYYNGEHVGNQTGSETELKVALDNSDTTRTYSFAKTYSVKDKDGNTLSGFTITPDNATTPTYYTIKSTNGMPAKDVYINIDVVEKYNMKLANIVVSDASTNKRTMLTETSDNTTSSTGNIGTITAIPKKGSTTGSDISGDGTNYYTYPDLNNADSVVAYTDSTNNKYLKTGLNKKGSDVEVGTTITYTFTFANGKDAEYSFVGWYEGTLDGDRFTVNYNKKLSGKTSFTYTPTKNTTVIAVGTRDIYIGGNFSDDQGSTASNTWTANRLKMEFDPTYVNPNDSTKKGRYYFKFEKVSANTEYKFRCYDTKSGTEFGNLVVWNKWLEGNGGYNTDNSDIALYRDKYAYDSSNHYTSHGGFMYTTATNKKITTARSQGGNEIGATHTISASHKANGYDAPVYVYFYAYDGGISVNSTYQWSKAYVSAGRGIDCTNYSEVMNNSATATYNTPTVEVAATTVKGGTVSIENQTYGNEAIKKCTVQEIDGQIKVTAKPGTDDLELHAFLVYNIDTKVSESVKAFTKSGSGSTVAFTGNITVPQNSSLYIVPIYKFTDTFISNNHLEAKTVYVRTDNIDKNDWGGLVAMYSWGSKTDSGGWPGQLMIPSDDGNSFYGQLAFGKNDLSGVTFNNYTSVWKGSFTNFLGLYDSNVSDTKYSSYTGTSTHYINQAYDYREPISIIENIDDGEIYDSDEMDLTFALKMGNKNGLHFGETNYDSGYSFEYLTDRSGKYRVDLNGDKLSTQSTETYYVVCNYTNKYKTAGNYDFKDGDRDATGTKMTYGIEWTVYANDANHTKIGTTKLSAAYTDVYKSEMLTYVAKMLVDYGYPVSGKAVKIAYEDPKEKLQDENNRDTEAKRFSGQWYADGVNTIVNGNVRVGIFSDGVYTVSNSNSQGYGQATASFTPETAKGEALVNEDGCSGNSLAKVTKIHATNGNVSFTVNTTENFLGWYRLNADGEYEPVGSNYKSQTITPSFNDDITFYAFYSASATYRFAYESRKGTTKYYTAKGTDLTEDELANNGTLNASTRANDVVSALSGRTGIKIFNHTLTYDLGTPDTSTPYTITYTAKRDVNQYTLSVFSYNTNGELEKKGSVKGTWSTELDVTTHESLGNGTALINNKPAGDSNKVFLGWKKYDNGSTQGDFISTRANFGYSITEDMSIAPVFGTKAEKDALSTSWKAGIDKNVTTQELTSSSVGTLYNDSLISFRKFSDTAEQLDISGDKECGLILLAQTKESTNNSTYSDNFDGLSNYDRYADYFVTGSGKEMSSAKMKSSNYGEAYAIRVKATSLSRLNRVDIVNALDYAKFNGGNFKAISYYYDGTKIILSDPVSGTLICS